jgi:tRNA(Ile2) C34 agmatinyltransferase TiaS
MAEVLTIVGLDDTDTLETRGTGHLAREVAAALSADYRVLGVTRHQLLVDPRVKCTKKNSCAAVLLEFSRSGDVDVIRRRVRALMLEHFVEGSDPGLCVVQGVPEAITEFGRRAQCDLVTQAEARSLAAAHNISLEGLGGDESGVIGALSAVGLATTGDDGRYVLVGRLRELQGLQPVSAVIEAGIAAVRTLSGEPVTDGLVQTDRLRPARRRGAPIAIVERLDGVWMPLKLD